MKLFSGNYFQDLNRNGKQKSEFEYSNDENV